MFLRKIVLRNFKCFENKDFSFNAINLVTGRNGIGKSTLILDSILFAIYGYSDKSLKDLVTKGKKDCSVTVEIDDLAITRTYPTALTIIKSGKELTIANSSEKQKFLDGIFKDVEYFRKFRMLDVRQGINILEAGKTTLLKTLTSFHQDYFNDRRQQLLAIKAEKETFNRDKLKLTTHYPSNCRIHLLEKHLQKAIATVVNTNRVWGIENNRLNNLNRGIGQVQNVLDEKTNQQSKLQKLNICPTCLQQVPDSHKLDIVLDLDVQIQDCMEHLRNASIDLNKQTNEVLELDQSRQEANDRKARLSKLLTVLQERTKQSAFKYTNRDIAITKKAIEELDIFVNKYIMNFVKVLEPIINDIIKKIDFEVKFGLDTKGNLDIKLLKNTHEYTYKELSTGQKLIMTVAFQLALLLQKGEHGLVIADEGFSSLSDENLEYVFSLFSQLPFQLVSVVHRINKIPSEVTVIDLEKYLV